MIRRWISALAPTSMPRVGSSRMRILGFVSSQRADQHLLLVAAGQVEDRLLELGRLDAELLLICLAVAAERRLR